MEHRDPAAPLGTATPALRAIAVSRSYRVGWRWTKRPALRAVTLDLERGRIHGLLGPNGSGKSTLLRLAAGLESPQSGRLEVLGGLPSEARQVARVGWLPSESPFPPELRALEVLELVAQLRGLTLPGDELRSALEAVGLGAEQRTPVRTFSRGMARRLGLAQAFLGQPELVLLDEATAGLDAPGFEVLDRLLDDARGQGKTVVLASHVLEDATDRCDSLTLLVKGEVRAHGTPAEVLGRPDVRGLWASGLSTSQWKDLENQVEQAGGRLVAERDSHRSLARLYEHAPEGER